MKKIERYTLVEGGLICRQDGEYIRAVEWDRQSSELHRVIQGRDLLIKAANEERDSAKRAATESDIELRKLRAGEAEPLAKTVLDLLIELQWHHEPYDDYYHKDSGYYCPECGNARDKGHDGGCAIDRVIKLLAGGEA